MDNSNSHDHKVKLHQLKVTVQKLTHSDRPPHSNPNSNSDLIVQEMISNAEAESKKCFHQFAIGISIFCILLISVSIMWYIFRPL